MHLNGKALVVAMLVTCSGCGNADVSNARRDHILAGDHGWIDLTVNSLAQDKDKEGKIDKSCGLAFSLNGEPLLDESANLAPAEENKLPIGYRFPAPAGVLQAELVISFCIKDAYIVKLPLTLTKDHLAKLRFDGKNLVLQDLSPYEPTTLEWVRSEIVKLQTSQQITHRSFSTLTWLAISSLVFNVIILLFILWRRRNV